MAILRAPLIVYPDSDTVDPTDTTVGFTVKIDGTVCQKYSLRIYELSTHTLKKTYSATLGTYLYDTETLTVNVDMTDANLGAGDFYWQIDLYWDSTHFVTSFTFPFYSNSAPTIAFTPAVPATITTQSYTFNGVYTQAQGVLVKWFEIKLYDANGVEIDTSGKTYSNNIFYTFLGFIDTIYYSVAIFGETANGVLFNTPITYFRVLYTALPIPDKTLVATLLDDSSVFIDMGTLQLVGVATGTTSYTSNFNYAGNYGLYMAASAYITFTIDFGTTFTCHCVYKPQSASFIGDMLEVNNIDGLHYAKIGYDGSRFYINRNGEIEYGIPEVLTTNNYIIAIKSDGTNIFEYHREDV